MKTKIKAYIFFKIILSLIEIEKKDMKFWIDFMQ